jgi:hypothetical protein
MNKHKQKITGTIGCFDRILFKGYLLVSWPQAMDSSMTNQGLLLMEFKPFLGVQSERLKKHSGAVSEKSGRPKIHLNGEIRKEEKARTIAYSDGMSEGLICILASVEACRASIWSPHRNGPLSSLPRASACACISISSIRNIPYHKLENAFLWI